MHVFVKLHGILRRHHPGPDGHEPLRVEMPPGSAVADLVPALNLPSPRVWTASVNYETVELDHPLNDGDRISLFPPVAGG